MKNKRIWLTGWKSIARALDTSVSTAQRWARQFKMPVKKGVTGRPEITVEDLTAWRKALSGNGDVT